MKKIITKSLVALALGTALTVTAMPAEARHCVYVQGHWSHGYWRPGHTVCYSNYAPRKCWWRYGRKYCAY